MEKPERSTPREVIHAILRGGAGAVPFAGSLIAETLSLLSDPAEARKERWLSELTETVNEIEEKLGVLPNSLKEDDEFVTFLYQATHIAIKNHQNEKIAALKTALYNKAKHKTESDLSLQYLRYVDELTVTHLLVLSAIDKHAGQFGRLLKLEQVLGKMEEVLGTKLDRIHFRAIIADLENRFLVTAKDIEELPEFSSTQAFMELESSKNQPIRVTSFSRAFLMFINNKIDA